MAYSTIVDLKNYVPEIYLTQLSDDADKGDLDVEKASDCIRRADDTIDGYMRGRYTLPLSTVPESIRDLSTKIAIYFLFKRSLIQIMPETLTSDYKESMSMLKDIQLGKFSPFETKDNPQWFVGNKSSLSAGVVTQTTNGWKSYLI